MATSGLWRSRWTTTGGTPTDEAAELVDTTTRSARKVWRTEAVAEAFIEADTMAITPTRPIPIMRAAAVAAVRRGLSIAFWRASAAGWPNRATRGVTMAHAAGPASTGRSSATPTNTAPDPTAVA